MAQFEVPQFIDVESKIVGPLTLKQFAFLAVPGLLVFFLFFVLGRFLWIIVAIILAGVGIGFAFIKIGSRPLYLITLYAIKFFWQPKLYLWKRALVEEEIPIPQRAAVPAATATQAVMARRSALQSALSGISGAALSITKLWQDLTTSKNPIPKREKDVPRRSIADIREQYTVFRKISGEKEVARRIDYR